jgi:proton glutamate symport protein
MTVPISSSDPEMATSPRRHAPSLMVQILIGMAAGIIVGAVLNAMPGEREWIVPNVLQPLGDIFIRLMQMIVVPLVFSIMVATVAGSDDRKLGTLGVKTMTYFIAVTSIAIIFGIVAANILQPGSGADISQMTSVHLDSARSVHGIGQFVEDVIPRNIVFAMGEGKILSVLFFAVLFGIGVAHLPNDQRQPIVTLVKSVAAAMFRVVNIVMMYSPIGVFGLVAVTVSSFGIASLLPLAKLIVATYITIALFVVIVLGLIARVAGVSLWKLIWYIKDELLIAFTTTTSAAVMPQLIKKLEAFGVPARVVNLTVPLGYSFNMDGGSLALGLGALFVAQLYNIPLGWPEQAMLVLTMVVTSKGAAGVSGYMFVVLSATLASAGLPVEGVAFLAGVYRFMEMATTTCNVLGNALAPIVIARWEGVPAASMRPPPQEPVLGGPVSF